MQRPLRLFSPVTRTIHAELVAVFVALASVIAVLDGLLLFAYFQVDDFNWLRLGTWPSVLASFHGPWGHDVAYRPLSRLSFYLDYRIFGWHAGAWHAENMALGAVAGSCLYAFARNLKMGRLPCLLAALLFVAAPLGSDNIIWISGRTGLLCLIFILLAMLCWLRGFDDPRWWILTGALYVSGMMTYEPALILPLLLTCLSPILWERKVALRAQVISIAALSAVGTAFWLLRSRLIGMAGTDVDPFYDSLSKAIKANSGSVADAFTATWGISGVCVLSVALFLALLRGKTRWTAIGLLLMAVVFYVPFLMVRGVAPRFLFMAQAPLCLLVTLPLRTSRGLLRYALLVATAGLILFFGRITHRQAYNMGKASNVGRKILDELARIESQQPSNMVIDGFPDTAFGYPIIWFYFEVALRTRLNSTLPVLARSTAVLTNATLLHDALTEPTRYFSYDTEKGTLSEMDRTAWVTRYSAQIHATGQAP